MIRSIILAIGLLAAAPAWAQSVQEQIIGQLQTQGFTKIELSRTLLGRIRVKAYSDTLERELVFNPTTGEILRDYWEQLGGGATTAPRVIVPSQNERTQSRSTDNSNSGSNSNGSNNQSSDNNDDDKVDDRGDSSDQTDHDNYANEDDSQDEGDAKDEQDNEDKNDDHHEDNHQDDKDEGDDD